MATVTTVALALLALVAGACATGEVRPDTAIDAPNATTEAAEESALRIDPELGAQPRASATNETDPPATTETTTPTSTPTAPGPQTDTQSQSSPTSEVDPPSTAATSALSADLATPPADEAHDETPTVTTTRGPEPTDGDPEAPKNVQALPADPTAPPADRPHDETPTVTTAQEPTGGNPGVPESVEALPGEPYEYGPTEGTSLAVVGVTYDDVLNVRDVPFGEIIATLRLTGSVADLLEVREAPSGEPIAGFDSWAGAIVATGRTRKLPTTVWHEIGVAGLTGWSSGAYLAPIGATYDLTARIIDRLGGAPVAKTLDDLALIVGGTMASDEPPSRVVVTVAPKVSGAFGEVTVDVLNIGDDSLLGYRLHLFAIPAGDPNSVDAGPFTLRTVESTVLCRSHRGVTADGLCI